MDRHHERIQTFDMLTANIAQWTYACNAGKKAKRKRLADFMLMKPK